MDETPYVNKADTFQVNPDGSAPDLIDGNAAAKKEAEEKETGEHDETKPGPVHSAFGDAYVGEVNVTIPKDGTLTDEEKHEDPTPA